MQKNKIHSTAIVKSNLTLGKNIIIEPYAVLGRDGFSGVTCLS